jgi:predicted nucleic acid-binding protein
MITAVDSSVILDVVTADSRFARKSARALREARRAGRLIVCETVIAEITPALQTEQTVRELMESWSLFFEASDLSVALLAGRIFRIYLDRGGSHRRVVPDFLIGAHALGRANRLLARDRGYLRDYFSELILIDPSIV